MSSTNNDKIIVMSRKNNRGISENFMDRKSTALNFGVKKGCSKGQPLMHTLKNPNCLHYLPVGGLENANRSGPTQNQKQFHELVKIPQVRCILC